MTLADFLALDPNEFQQDTNEHLSPQIKFQQNKQRMT